MAAVARPSVASGSAGIGIVLPVAALSGVIAHVRIDLIGVPGVFLCFPAQPLGIVLPLFRFLAQSFGVHLGLLGISVSAGGTCLPLTCFQVLGVRLFPNLVSAIVILPALLLIVCVLALPSKEYDQSDDEQHYEDPDDDPSQRRCVHCLHLPEEGSHVCAW